jgi:hypothetical protein
MALSGPCANLPRNNQPKHRLTAGQCNSSLVAVRLAWSKFAQMEHVLFLCMLNTGCSGQMGTGMSAVHLRNAFNCEDLYLDATED